MTKGLKKYLLLFVGLAIFLIAYFLVYTNYTDKTDALNTEMKTLSDRLVLLEGYNSKLPKYRDSMKSDKEMINGTLSTYYSMERPEDFIMLATELEKEEIAGADITSMFFSEPEPFYEITGIKAIEDDTLPAEPMTLTTYMISSSLTGTMTYSQMKQILDYVYALKDVTRLESLSISYDSASGLLLGNIALNKYYITGRDIPEHNPVIPYDNIGKAILMGS